MKPALNDDFCIFHKYVYFKEVLKNKIEFEARHVGTSLMISLFCFTYSYVHPKQLKHGTMVMCWACCCKKKHMWRNGDLDNGVVWMLYPISITITIQQVYFGFLCQGNLSLPLSTRDVCQWSKLYLSSPPFKLTVASVGGFAQTTVMFYKLMRERRLVTFLTKIWKVCSLAQVTFILMTIQANRWGFLYLRWATQT